VTEPSHRYPRTPGPVGALPEPMRTPTSSSFRVSTPGPTRASLPELPPDTHPAWESMIKNPDRHEFKFAAAGMLIFNLNLQWKNDPGKLSTLVRQARAFFFKYQHLLANDIQRIFI
jgi:hypothetical protein